MVPDHRRITTTYPSTLVYSRMADHNLNVLVIAGPTASGKSGLALRLAEELGGVVINADSMQVYSDLRVLTARPSIEDEARVPHKLYGYLDGAEVCTAAAWAARAAEEITTARNNNQVPIVVGGTGLYLKALIEGLSDIPEVPWIKIPKGLRVSNRKIANAFCVLGKSSRPLAHLFTFGRPSHSPNR